MSSQYLFRSSIKETGTVASRACCDLMAERRLCLTGTPVQNKLDDVFALIKFLQLEPFNDKTLWTEFIGTPIKFGQTLGVARLQTIMKCISLRRTKETRLPNGRKILDLPPRRDELRFLQFDEQEKSIYNKFFDESKAEFTEMSNKNEVLKNYVGILQRILRLRQICDHFELVDGKAPGDEQAAGGLTSDNIVAAIERHGFSQAHANAIFTILRDSATAQCVECGDELSPVDPAEADNIESESPQKRSKKGKNPSRAPTRANSPSIPRLVLTRCQHLFCLGCFQNNVFPGWPNVDPDIKKGCNICQSILASSDAFEVKPDNVPSDGGAKKKTQRKEKRQKGGMCLENFHPSTKIKALLNDLVQSSKANPYSANYDPSSIDIQMVDNEGRQLDDGIVKTVVL
jgi:SWI/SNF-related matrix-associated actin-dependent regulator of chromatin subfamily A3